MRINRVTITGADDKVDPGALEQLSQDFPFVEWGLLLSRSQKGTARYPSGEWLQKFYARGCRVSWHLCGAMSRESMAGDPRVQLCPEIEYSRERPNIGHSPQRVQLNGFSNFILPGLQVAKVHTIEFILQCKDLDAVRRSWDLTDRYPNTSMLWDPSGGTGKQIDWRTRPMPAGSSKYGYAGGINESNIEQTLAMLSGDCSDVEHEHAPVWIDLETGARSGDNEFDLEKVRRLLTLAAPFIRP